MWPTTLPGRSIVEQHLEARLCLSCYRADIIEEEKQACGLAAAGQEGPWIDGARAFRHNTSIPA